MTNRTLTVLTILLTIPTIIASLYGMNVKLPLGDHPQAFYIVLCAILATVIGVVLLFKHHKWL
jgi:magnesium transporter